MSLASINRYVITLSCPDQRGIVASVSGFLFANACNIIDSQQFDDRLRGDFFMRVTFDNEGELSADQLRADFSVVANRFSMDWQMFDLASKPRVLILVSKFGHCLNDLLYRASTNALPIEVAAIVSNHPDLKPLADAASVPFVHIPVTPATKEEAEAKLMALVEQELCDLVVLARYMQILSKDLCRKLSGRAINIHHSFLPSFKGARPYHQAHARGVKLIGATAHYVTADLDEGPIIEQQVVRVDHSQTPEDYVAAGREVEASVLARAVHWHAEHRVLLNGSTTVVLR